MLAKKINFWAIGLVVILLGIILLLTCNRRTPSIVQDNHKYDSVLNSKNQVIYEQEAQITSSKVALKNMTDSIFALKRKHEREIKGITAYYSERTVTQIKNVYVSYVDTSAYPVLSDSLTKICAEKLSNVIPVPRTGIISTDTFFAVMTVEKEGITVNQIEIPDTQHVRFTEIKGGFLKKDLEGKRHFILGKQYGVQVLHTNPAIKVQGQKSAAYKQKSNFLKHALIGAGAVLTGIILIK